MAEDSRPPADEPSALPRRTPGAGGLTPGQARRGFLSPRGTATPAPASPSDAPRTDQAGASSPPRPAGSLPRRSPGTSAIQAPRRTARPLRAAPAPGDNEAADPDRSAPPSPSSLASSAASLLRATAAAELAAAAAAELAAAVAPRIASPETTQESVPARAPVASLAASTATAEPAGSPPETAARAPAKSPTGIVPPPADGPFPRPALPAGRRRGVGPARRWQLAGLILAVVVVTGAVAALIAGHKPASGASSASGQAGRQRLASASAVRRQAAEWVASQVGHDVLVACDAATCRALAAHGFPASNLNVVQPTAPDPYGSVLVIATAAIRSQFGLKLDAVYAPQVIASFGVGPTRIDIRAIAAQGPAAFSTALAADLAARKSSGALLLRNPRITVAGGARQLLTDGLIDLRLLTTIAFLATQHPIDIVGFGGAAPGAAPVPLRSVYLAESDAAAQMTASAYLQALESGLHALIPPYVPLSVASVQLGGGPPVLQVEYGAPSPLGLLHS